MLAQDLKRLADVAEIAKLDMAPGAVTLAPTELGTLAYYEGAYAAGGIIIDSAELSDAVSVSAVDFTQIVGLFDNNTDVKLRVAPRSLILQSATRRFELRFRGNPTTEGYLTLQATERQGKAKLPQLLKEASFASNVAAGSMSAPILRGIRMVRSKTAVGIQAANGTSLIFETTIPGTGREKVEVVSPADDLLLALRVLGAGDDVEFGQAGRTLVLSNSHAIVKIMTLAGSWPAMSNMKALIFREAISIPVPSIRALIAAARAFKSGSDAVFRPGKGQTIIMETDETETGQFLEVIPGLVSKTYVLDIADLDVASKMVNDSVVLEFSDTMARMTVDDRKLYLLTRSR